MLITFAVLLAIVSCCLMPGARWIGSKRLKLQLPAGTTLNNVSFYECYGTLDEIVASQTTEDFHRISQFSYIEGETVVLMLKVTGVDYLVGNWFDLRTEPTFILTVIEDPVGLVTQKLIAQNSPERNTAVAVPLATKP